MYYDVDTNIYICICSSLCLYCVVERITEFNSNSVIMVVKLQFFHVFVYYCRARELLLQVKIIVVEPFLFKRFSSVVRAAILKDNEDATAFVEYQHL